MLNTHNINVKCIKTEVTAMANDLFIRSQLLFR